MKLLASTLLMPPGLGIFLCLIAFYFLRQKRLFLGKSLMLFAIVVSWAFSTEAMGRFLSVALISQVQTRSDIKPEEADAIVVLTGGMEYAGKIGWIPRNESYRRGMVAFELQSRVGSRIPVLLSGGKTQGLKYPSESQVLLRQFDRHRAQITPTILEETSTNTYENALQSVAILQNKGMDKIFLVTSEVHMLRSLASFRGRGIDPMAIPVFTLDRRPLEFADYLPSWKGVELTSKAVYEMLGIVNYIMAGYIRSDDVFYGKSSS